MPEVGCPEPARVLQRMESTRSCCASSCARSSSMSTWCLTDSVPAISSPLVTSSGALSRWELRVEDAALEDVLSLDTHQVIAAHSPALTDHAVGMAQPGPLQCVAHAARVGEARHGHAPFEELPEGSLGLPREAV